MAEPSGPEIILIGDSHFFRRTAVSLYDTTTEPPVVCSGHVNAVIVIWGYGDRIFSFGSLDSFPEVQREGIRWSGNDGVSMNPPETI